jgi:hypothetical protein
VGAALGRLALHAARTAVHAVRPVTHGDPARGKITRSTLDKSGTRCRCGKRTYSSKKVAKADAARRTRETGEVLQAFHCFSAHGWHLGHPRAA